jgi:hypothetical protein
MIPRQKCAHCGKLADFKDEFCTSCWSHRTKGKVLTNEQITKCETQYAALNEKKRWQATLGTRQNRLLLPTILMVLWSVYGVFSLLPFYLKFGLGQLELAINVFCSASFAIGGYLVGGARALKAACYLLILASLAATYHIGDYLMEVLHDEAEIDEGFLYSCLRLVFCGTILISSIQILRLKRPAA